MRRRLPSEPAHSLHIAKPQERGEVHLGCGSGQGCKIQAPRKSLTASGFCGQTPSFLPTIPFSPAVSL